MIGVAYLGASGQVATFPVRPAGGGIVFANGHPPRIGT